MTQIPPPPPPNPLPTVDTPPPPVAEVEPYNPRALPATIEGAECFDYDVEKANHILDRIEEGESLDELADRVETVQPRNVIRWCDLSPKFETEYLLSRKIQADVLMDKSIAASLKATNAQLVKAHNDILTNYSGVWNDRYKAKTRTELTGKDGGPIATVNTSLVVDRDMFASPEEYRDATDEWMRRLGYLPYTMDGKSELDDKA